jgi:hypothetical protein
MTEPKSSQSLEQVVLWNVAIVAGIGIGFLGIERYPAPNVTGRIAVFSLAFFNLLLVGLKNRSEGQHQMRSVWTVLAQRPLISTLVTLQLWSAGQGIGAVISLVSAYHSPQVLSQQLQGRLILVSFVMSVVAALWLAGAFGLWQQRKWAWWLALILNSLSASACVILQVAAILVLKHNEFLLDLVATAMVVLLVLRRTRPLFGVEDIGKMDVHRA